MALPLPEADLSKLKLKSKLKDGQVIKILAKEWITVYLEGAVEEQGALKVLKGTKLQDLSESVHFLPDADSAKLNKKRVLKDEEVINVPCKKVKPPKKPTPKKKIPKTDSN